MATYVAEALNDPSKFFKVQLYTGSGGTQSITFDDTDTDMQPDLVWIKSRNDTNPHTVVDAVRGATKVIWTNVTSGEGTFTDEVTAFDSDGFSLGASSNAYANESSETHVAWCWKESADAGFDIVDYDGDGGTRTVSHSLSAVPHVIITKVYERNGENWAVYHHKNTSAPETDYLLLNNTNATADQTNYWNDTAPTSSVFTVGGQNDTNASGQDVIGYLWTAKQGFSKFGSYTGNGNADGTFIFCGLRPAWLMIKRTDSTDGWLIVDNKRAGYNGGNNVLEADVADAEDTGVADRVDILSNGFKLRNSWSKINTSGGTYIYMAFAEAPFVNSNGVPNNAR